MALISKNPATEEVLAEFRELTPKQIEEKLTLGQSAFIKWRKADFVIRKKHMRALAKILKENSREIAGTLTLEMGKPILESVAEIEKCAWVCEYYYAEHAERFLAPEKVEIDGAESFIRFEPLGVVLAVMPWNFPFWQVFRFAAPAIMAGNVGILKHASNVPQSAEKIERLFLEAGFPEGVFQNFLIGATKVEGIIRDPRVKAVTLTGSEYAGSQVAKVAGEAIKKTVLELGGSDPFIVLEDADIQATCDAAVRARLQNNGQSCIAAKRLILTESIADKFLQFYRKRYESLRVGDPMDEKTDIGPLATESILNDIETQVKKSVEAGANILTGGKRIGKRGYFYAPTILTGAAKGMPAYDEELFGPVAVVMVVKNAEEAIRVANDTLFGLGASIWTRDIDRAKKLIPEINAGAVFVNSIVRSDPRLPFGGIGKSGYGRELSHYGIKEFVNIKTVYIKNANNK